MDRGRDDRYRVRSAAAPTHVRLNWPGHRAPRAALPPATIPPRAGPTLSGCETGSGPRYDDDLAAMFEILFCFLAEMLLNVVLVLAMGAFTLLMDIAS